MPGFLRILSSRAVPVVRGHSVSQTANVYSKAAKEKIGIVVSHPLCRMQLKRTSGTS